MKCASVGKMFFADVFIQTKVKAYKSGIISRQCGKSCSGLQEFVYCSCS